MSQLFQRRPRGEPAGGQFTALDRPRAEVSLSTDELGEVTHPRVSTDRLRELADSMNAEVRAAVARHPKSEPEVRSYLVYDEDPVVRMAVLDNADISDHIIEVLVNDENADVRAAVATHSKVTLGQLALMARDDNQAVRDAARLELFGRGTDVETQSARFTAGVLSRQAEWEGVVG